ncbi:unnamed protein product [Ambrosiozyma monospora]|uniref:Unnamed protein product n=1 Tax=Ambrosiozyma monospora TaxID=43982 RepID=A0A9W6Z303_AMBMO|nr:unnamed protein product [Ambrosiozyma monospora]
MIQESGLRGGFMQATDEQVSSSSNNSLLNSKKKQKLSTSKPQSIDTKSWPENFKQLLDIHFRLNSYYTFLSSRKHVITTLDLLKEPVEKAIKRPLEQIDVARIACLIPDDVVFDYFDENQFVLEEKHFTWKDGYQQKDVDIYDLKDDVGEENHAKQLLVLEFIDGDLQKSKTNSSFTTKKQDLELPVYTQESIKRLIIKRNNKFKIIVDEFLKECREKGITDPWAELDLRAQSRVPKPFDYIDPIEEMVKNSLEGKGNTGSTERPTMSVMIDKLKQAPFYKDQIENGAEFVLDSRKAEYEDEETEFQLSPLLKAALQESKGINRLYSHQSEAMQAISQGKNVIISTSTSSGKSLVYQIPVLNSLETKLSTTAMYIFPTKALAQDQKRSLKDLLSFIDDSNFQNLVVETYDGDTEKKQRQFVRYNASIIFTNPDIIHASMLPNHQQWRRFLVNLKFVIVDELHMYKGLFGSHVALIMRRLRRVCSFLGNDDVCFISCSATLKDPVMHMHNIFGIELDSITHIDRDGSPSGCKHLVVWNPPYIDAGDKLAGRQNFISESAKIVVELMKNNVRTIVFCVVRKVVELLMKEVRSILQNGIDHRSQKDSNDVDVDYKDLLGQN